MNEREFIRKLKERAREQELLIKSMPMHRVFSSVSVWLGNHPWRILVPVAIILTLVFHLAFGKSYDDFILKEFVKL